MAIEFKEKETPDNGWSIEVLSGGTLVGHIRRHPISKAYRYFDGPDNDLLADLVDESLESLKARVNRRRR